MAEICCDGECCDDRHHRFILCWAMMEAIHNDTRATFTPRSRCRDLHLIFSWDSLRCHIRRIKEAQAATYENLLKPGRYRDVLFLTSIRERDNMPFLIRPFSSCHHHNKSLAYLKLSKLWYTSICKAGKESKCAPTSSPSSLR